MAIKSRSESLEAPAFSDFFQANLPMFGATTEEYLCSRIEAGLGRFEPSRAIGDFGRRSFVTADATGSRSDVDFEDFKSTEEEDEVVDYLSFGPSTPCSSDCGLPDNKSFGSCEDLNSDDADSGYSGESSNVSYSSSPVRMSSFNSFPYVEQPNASRGNNASLRCSGKSHADDDYRVEESHNVAEESDTESLPFEEEAGGEFGAFDSEFIPCLYGGRQENLTSCTNSSFLQIKMDSPRLSYFDFMRGLGLYDKETDTQRVIDDIVNKTLETMSSWDRKDLEKSDKLASEEVENVGVKEIYFDPKNFPGVIKVDKSLIDLKNKRLKYKTDLCRHYLLTGKCPFGNNCTFAHGMDELRKKIVPLEYKTRVCKDYLEGVCEYGYKCTFAHVSD